MWKWIVGAVSSIACLLAVFVFSCWLYFVIRKKHAHAKFAVEAAFIFVAISISILAKMAIFFTLQQRHEFIDGFNTFLQAIYAGIGGLTFEGLESFEGDSVSVLLQWFYFASSVYAGVTTLFIISAKANYEFYSALYFRSLDLGRIKNRNVHVITALTEETMYLARDIREHDAQAVVVFASPTLEPFDRQNELCREVMARGYLYWSYSKDKKKTQSIASVLHLNKQNNKEDFNLHFVVYAFDSKDHIPQEENNLDLVFDDILARIANKDNLRVEYCLLTRREINFQAYGQLNNEMILKYAQSNLSGKTLNEHRKDVWKKYQEDVAKRMTDLEKAKMERASLSPNESPVATEEVFDSLLEKYGAQDISCENVLEFFLADEGFAKFFFTGAGCFGKSWKALANAIKEDYAKAVVLNVWCEAFAIGRQTIETMFATNVCNAQSPAKGNGTKATQKYTFADYLAQTDDGIRIWTIGFSITGQSLTNELFVQTTGVDEKGATRDFMADVFDMDAAELGGIYCASRPGNYYLYNETIQQNAEWQNLLATFDNWCAERGGELGNAELLSDCRKYLQDTALPLHFRNQLAEKNGTDKEIATPIFSFHPVSCNEFAFFDTIDQHMGAECKSHKYNNAVSAVLQKLDETLAQNTQEGDIAAAEQLQKLRAVLQSASESTMPAYPQVIVISTGDDYRNIRLANFLVQDISNEHSGSTKGNKQYIVVNVWDKHNNPLIVSGNGTWNENHDVLIADDFVVLVVGNNDKIYTYASIVGRTSEENYNATYQGMSTWMYDSKLIMPDSNILVSNIIKDDAPKWLKSPEECVEKSHEQCEYLLQTMQTVFGLIAGKGNADHGNIDSKWVDEATNVLNKLIPGNAVLDFGKLDIWRKESTRSATLFAPVHRQTYLELCKKCKNNKGEVDLVRVYSRLSVLEHCRWVRMHQINGWVYNKQKMEIVRHHNCILPFVDLQNDVILYDTLNAMWAIAQPDK